MNFWDYDSYTPTTDYSSGANYSLSSGSSSFGLQAPSYTSYDNQYSLAGNGGGGIGLNYSPSYDYSGGVNYGLGSSGGGGGGRGLSAPSYTGGPRLQAGNWDGGGTGGSGSAFTLSPYAMTGTGPSSGSGVSMGTTPGGPGLRVGQGTFNAGAGAGTAGLPTQQATPAGGNSGITGAFGGIGDALNRFEQWGKANPRTAALLNYGVGALAERSGQKRASRAMDRQNQMQQEAMASQRQAVDQNNQQAGFWNQQAQQSANEARSLYNPQELGIRGMAQQVATTGRREQETRQAAMKRGMSAADADAEARRVRLAGSTAATTGYMAGLDTGRQAQGAALSGAKGLSSPYQGLGAYSPNATEANFLAQQGGNQGAQLQQLLEFYTGSPSRRILRERELGEQKEST